MLLNEKYIKYNHKWESLKNNKLRLNISKKLIISANNGIIYINLF